MLWIASGITSEVAGYRLLSCWFIIFVNPVIKQIFTPTPHCFHQIPRIFVKGESYRMLYAVTGLYSV